MSANNTVAANSPVEMRRTETSGLGLFATRKILKLFFVLVTRKNSTTVHVEPIAVVH